MKNSLLEIKPELAKEWHPTKNGMLTPAEVTIGSHKKVWWLGSCGHEWEAQIKARCSGTRCPYCSGNKVLKGFNDFATIHPELLEEWDFDKNKEIHPGEITFGSNVKVWWKCSAGHEWQAQVKSRHAGRGCPYCSGRELLTGYNDLKTTNPEYLKEWNYDRNKDIRPEDIMSGSHTQVWWICNKGHEWKASPNHRISKGRGCPYCCHNPAVLTGENDLETVYPLLIKEWDYEKNDIKPSEITAKSNKVVWWKCYKGHEWRTSIEHRANGSGCPYCARGAQTSFPEQAVYYYVSKAYPDAFHKYKDLFTKKGMELDVYIPSLKTGIEYDGIAFHNDERQIKNDNEKTKICKLNDIYLIRIKEDPTGGASADSIISAESGLEKALEDLKSLIPGIGIIDLKKDEDDIRSRYLDNLAENSLLSLNPALCEEWNYEKNKTTPDMYSPNSNSKVWWKCSLGHEWRTSIDVRSAGRGCPYCSNNRVLPGFNDLASKRPDLLKEWHPTKNDNLDPTKVLPGSGKKAWWICSKGHEWQAEISSRNKGSGCPECYRQKRSKCK